MSDDINNSMNYSNGTSEVNEAKEADESIENSEIDDNSKTNKGNSETNDISDNIRPFEIDEVGGEDFKGIKKRKFAILLTIIGVAIIIGIAITLQKICYE